MTNLYNEGNVVDGDTIIAISAYDLKLRNKLEKNTVVMTVMSNIGFFKFAEKEGIDVVSTKVGDRYVLEEMRDKGYIIGGEQSGHIIYLEYASTGDGQLSAIQLLATMKRTGKTLKELASIMDQYPQVLVNMLKKITLITKVLLMQSQKLKTNLVMMAEC